MGLNGHYSSRGSERRAFRRYPVHVEVQYRVKCGQGQVKTGLGQTLDISSHGVYFLSSEPLPVGAQIEMNVAWPAGGRENRMVLAVVGQTVRGEGNRIAVAIRNLAFHISSELAGDDAAQIIW